jgi:hypothetical protein
MHSYWSFDCAFIWNLKLEFWFEFGIETENRKRNLTLGRNLSVSPPLRNPFLHIDHFTCQPNWAASARPHPPVLCPIVGPTRQHIHRMPLHTADRALATHRLWHVGSVRQVRLRRTWVYNKPPYRSSRTMGRLGANRLPRGVDSAL